MTNVISLQDRRIYVPLRKLAAASNELSAIQALLILATGQSFALGLNRTEKQLLEIEHLRINFVLGDLDFFISRAVFCTRNSIPIRDICYCFEGQSRLTYNPQPRTEFPKRFLSAMQFTYEFCFVVNVLLLELDHHKKTRGRS